MYHEASRLFLTSFQNHYLEIYTTLEEFLATVRDAREYKRALVVQLCERGQRAAEVAGVVDEAVTGVRVVKGFGQEGRELRNLATTGGRLFRSRMRLIRLQAAFTPTLQAVPVFGQVAVLAFGDAVFTPSGDIDRKALGGIVFNDPTRRKQLESFIHPKVRREVEAFFTRHTSDRLAVAVIPLLFESNLEKYYDVVWLVKATKDQQIDRLVATRGIRAPAEPAGGGVGQGLGPGQRRAVDLAARRERPPPPRRSAWHRLVRRRGPHCAGEHAGRLRASHSRIRRRGTRSESRTGNGRRRRSAVTG